MSVTVKVKATGQAVTGKYAVIEAGKVGLFSGIMSDKKGGWRGCGKKTTYEASAVTVTADDAARELKRK